MLRELDLTKCEVSQMENYREKVFELLKSLIFLNGFDKDNKVEAQSKTFKDSGKNYRVKPGIKGFQIFSVL